MSSSLFTDSRYDDCFCFRFYLEAKTSMVLHWRSVGPTVSNDMMFLDPIEPQIDIRNGIFPVHSTARVVKIIWHKNINIHTWSTFNDSLNRYICLGYTFAYKWIMLFISALGKKSNLLELHRLIVLRNNIRDTSNSLKRYSGLVYLLSFSSIATSRIGKRAFIKIIDLHSYSVMTN